MLGCRVGVRIMMSVRVSLGLGCRVSFRVRVMVKVPCSDYQTAYCTSLDWELC